MAGKTMDIRQQEQTWHGFVKFTTYSTAGLVVLLALMAFFLI